MWKERQKQTNEKKSSPSTISIIIPPEPNVRKTTTLPGTGWDSIPVAGAAGPRRRSHSPQVCRGGGGCCRWGSEDRDCKASSSSSSAMAFNRNATISFAVSCSSRRLNFWYSSGVACFVGVHVNNIFFSFSTSVLFAKKLPKKYRKMLGL